MQLLVQAALQDGVILVLWKQRLAVTCSRLARAEAGRHDGGDEVWSRVWVTESRRVVEVLEVVVEMWEGTCGQE